MISAWTTLVLTNVALATIAMVALLHAPFVPTALGAVGAGILLLLCEPLVARRPRR